MFTPNCCDQNTGVARCGQWSPGGLTMLWAATSAWVMALPQCSSARNWYSYSGCGNRATSPATKMSSVVTALISTARQPASQATPQMPTARPESCSHSVLHLDGRISQRRADGPGYQQMLGMRAGHEGGVDSSRIDGFAGCRHGRVAGDRVAAGDRVIERVPEARGCGWRADDPDRCRARVRVMQGADE